MPEPTDPDDTTARPRFRLAFVPGVTPGKWARTWEERLPDVPIDLVGCENAQGTAAVRAQQADAALVRLPVDRDGLHAIPLYTEATVVVLPKEHTLTLSDALTPDEIADEIVHHPLDDVLAWDGPPGIPSHQRPEATRDALDLVVAGVGLTVMPQSLARLHHRKDLTYRPIDGEAIARSQVALIWPEDGTSDLMEEFIGIVRGRTPNSSRGLRGERQKQAADSQRQRGATPPRTAKPRRSRPKDGRSRGTPRRKRR